MAEPPANEQRPLAEISHGPSAFENFLEKNQKLLLVVGIALALGTAAWVVQRGIKEGADRSGGAALVAATDSAALKDLIATHAGSPAAASAALLLADAQWEEGQQDAALTTLQQIIASNPDHPAVPAARTRLAARLAQQGKAAEATAEFETLLKDPRAAYAAPYALISLGELAKAAGELEKAGDFFKRASEQYPGNPLTQVAGEQTRFLDFTMPVEIDPPAVEETAEEPVEESLEQPAPEIDANPLLDALNAGSAAIDPDAPAETPSQDATPPEAGK